MKYGYIFQDWNLYDIEEIAEVQELPEEFLKKHPNIDPRYWCGVTYSDGRCSIFIRAHIFDTKDEAELYGADHSRCF